MLARTPSLTLYRSTLRPILVSKPLLPMPPRSQSFHSSPILQDPQHWSPTQYLQFAPQRTRPVHDLLAQVSPHITTTTPRIFDLGCGPGNSTQALQDAFPQATITAMDSSPDMLAQARTALPAINFQEADLETYEPGAADLLFSNAVLHWLRTPTRIQTLTRLFAALDPGAVLALQVPDNYTQASHALMRRVASLPHRPWTPHFADACIGQLDVATRPDLDPIEPPAAWYEALGPLARDVQVWRTEYMHVLPGAKEIVEWVRGTGLRPFLQRMKGDKEVGRAFLEEYEGRLAEAYPRLKSGGVVLGYPRLFVVAVRG